MALPALIAAGSGIVAVAIAIAKWVQAVAATVTAAMQSVIAWFTAHKIIFSLFLAACWIAVWGLILSIVWAVARWGVGIAFADSEGFADLVHYLSYFADWIDYTAIVQLFNLSITLFSAEILLRNSVAARRFVYEFLQGLSNVFHG